MMEVISPVDERVLDLRMNRDILEKDVRVFELDDKRGTSVERDGMQALDRDYSSCRPRQEFVAPAVGMEFESYDDVYNYYNCYAKDAGFCVRVKNSWFKRNSKEKYGAVLCCSSQGFKRIKDVNRLRKETRTGCPAMIRMRLVDTKRWRIVEVALDHNHLLGSKFCKSVKKLSSCTKRDSISNSDSEVRKIKLYHALAIDARGNGICNRVARDATSGSSKSYQFSLRKGDSQSVYNYFCRMQMTNPNFFHAVDFNVDGSMRNVFWADARSRAASGYFGEIVLFDNTYVSNKFETPLVTFVGVNHHGQSVLLGCGLLSSETTESYMWIFRTWVTCMIGHIPETIITDRCLYLQTAIAEVFPRSRHHFGLSHIMRRIPEKLGGLINYDAIRKALTKAVYETLKVSEFETAWRFMVHHFGVTDNEWLQSLYNDRALWVPVYLKDVFFAGMAAASPGDSLIPFFDKYIHKHTPLKEFFDKYELAVQKKHKEEMIADNESRNSTPILKSRCSFELQLSKIYTKAMFGKFQVEVEEMYSCFSTMQLHVDGPITIFLVKERFLAERNRREIRDFEVMYDRSASEVQCICSCFNFNGYLCRHSLCVLNFNGVEEIPSKYIMPRWRKDYKSLYTPVSRSDDGDSPDQVQLFNRLYRSALQVVEEGVLSYDHYKVALKAFEESFNMIHDLDRKV